MTYADPPYPGKAHLYRGHRDHAGEVDHAELIRRLSTHDGVGAIYLGRSTAAGAGAVPARCGWTPRHRGDALADARRRDRIRVTHSWRPLTRRCDDRKRGGDNHG